jgi:hypothetical protein
LIYSFVIAGSTRQSIIEQLCFQMDARVKPAHDKSEAQSIESS